MRRRLMLAAGIVTIPVTFVAGMAALPARSAAGATVAAAPAATVAAAPGATVAAAPAASPRASLVGFACHRALDPLDRSIFVQSVMRPLPGTRRMEVRFALLERVRGQARAVSVRGQRLDAWIVPTDPTLGRLPGDVWRVDKPVINLPAPARYRFRVRFRWIGAGGHVLGRALRVSHVCRQRELRPDLLVRSIAVDALAARPGYDLYTVMIANRGATGAGPFEVLFAPGGAGSPVPRMIRLLGPRRERQLRFAGPTCEPSSPPTVTVDAADQIDDYDRANNTLAAVCPASGGG